MNHPGRATSKSMQGPAADSSRNAAENPQSGATSFRDSSKASADDAKRKRNQRSSEDKKLVARAKQGDRAAFRELFDRYHQRAYTVALGMVRNHQDAQDILQDAFVKAFRHIEKFKGDSSFYTWFYRIVMNLSIDHTRRKKRVRHEDYEDLAERRELEPPSGSRNQGISPQAGTLSRELRGEIKKALESLPEHHRAVIVLREVEEFSYEEIAETLEIPKGTVMSRLFHARRKMQEQLSGYVVPAPRTPETSSPSSANQASANRASANRDRGGE